MILASSTVVSANNIFALFLYENLVLCFRWHSISDRLSRQLQNFTRLLSLWEDYQDNYQKCRSWVEDKERRVNKLLLQHDTVAATQEHLAQATVSIPVTMFV